MVRKIDWQYLIDLVKLNSWDQELNFFFCGKNNCKFCKKSRLLEEELRKRKFSTLNSDALDWKITYYQNDLSILTIFPVHENWILLK